MRRNRIMICALLLASVFFIMVASASYPMFHYDAQRSGNVTGHAPVISNMLWSTEIGGLIGSSPVVSDGKVFISNWFVDWEKKGKLYCLDAQTGEILWNNSIGSNGSTSTAAIAEGKVFVGSVSGDIHCIDVSSGEKIWSREIENNPGSHGVASSPLIYDGKVFVTSFSDGTLHVFDFEGNELWNLSTGNAINWYTSPAAVDDKVFFAANIDNYTLCSVNMSSHYLLWSFNTSTEVKSTPAINDDTIFFASADRLYAVNITTGKELWNSSFSCSMSSPAVSSSRVYIGSSNSRLYCYDADDGSELWNTTVNGPIYSSPVVANNTVYFGTNTANGTIYALNATDGTLRWLYALSPPSGSYYYIMSSPAVADEILFIGADNGRVYAFGEKPAVTAKIRIEGSNETIWSGEVTFSNSTIADTNGTLHHIPYPSALGALDEASKKGNFSYEVVYYSSYDALYVKSIANESDWWHYWVNYTLPCVGADKYEIKEGDYVLWGCSEGWTSSPLKMSVEKDIVKINETFNVTVFNVSANITTPLENATIYVHSLNYSTNEEGNATISLDKVGLYEVYAEKDGYIRSEKEKIQVLPNIATITVRIEGQNATIWSGKVTFGNSTIVDADNVSHYLDKPTALGAVDAASKLGNFSYEVVYYPDYDSLYLKTIGNDSDWWHYWVNYTLPMVGAEKYGIKEEDYVLWGYSESWTPSPLEISLEKESVKEGESFNVTIFNVSENLRTPLNNATVYVDSQSYKTDKKGNITISISNAGTYRIYAEKEGYIRSKRKEVEVLPNIARVKVRIEGKNETIWNGEVTFGNSTILDTDNVLHYLDKPTALGAVDAASKLGNFSYEVENQTWGLFLKSICGEAYDPITWDPSWMYRVDYYSPMAGAADFVLNVTEPPPVPHDEVLWYYGSWTMDPLNVTLDKTSVTAGESFNATVKYYNDTTSGWDTLDNATVYIGTLNYMTGSDGNATISLSSAGTYTVYAEKEGFVRSSKRNVSVFLPHINVRIEGKNETIWNGEVTFGNSTIVDTDNVSHYLDKPTALGAVDAASKLGNFSYEVENQTWGLFLKSISGEAYNPATWDGWMYRVDYYSPAVGAAGFVINVTEPPSTPHKEILWYYGSWTDVPLNITLDKTSVKVNEHFTARVESYNDTSGLWDLVDNATVYVDSSNYTTNINGSVTISIPNAGSYTVYAEKEGYTRSERKTVRGTPTGDGDNGGPSNWITVKLEPGTFNVTATTFSEPPSKEYTVNRLTPLGALDKSGKSYKVTDKWKQALGYLFLYSIDGKISLDESGEPKGEEGWKCWVNDKRVDTGVDDYENYKLDDGDKVYLFWGGIGDTPENSSDVIYRIKVSISPKYYGSSGNGGNSISPTPTPAPINETKPIEPIEAGENASVTFEKIGITRIVINANNTIRNATITIQQIEKRPENITNVSGIFYCYFNITTTNLTATNITNATIEFKVNKTWLNESDIDETTITLNRYSDIDNNWSALPTSKIKEDNASLYFESETPGFSLFAVSGEEKTALPPAALTPSPPVTPKTTHPPATTPTPASTPSASIPRIKWIIITAVVVASLLIALVAYLTLRVRKE